MKKTSKKLLSLFLAVVMAVSACSVGFTALAAETNPDYKLFNDSNSLDAESSIDAINELLDNRLPDILDMIGADSLAAIGIDAQDIEDIKNYDSGGKYDSDAFYAFMTKLADYLLGMINGNGTATASYFGEDYSNLTDWQYSFVEDESAPVSYFALLNYAEKMQDSEYKAAAKYSEENLDDLQALTEPFTEELASQESAATNVETGLVAALLKEAAVADTVDAAFNSGKGFSYQLIADTVVAIDGTQYALSKSNTAYPYILEAPAYANYSEADVEAYVNGYKAEAAQVGLGWFDPAADVAGALYCHYMFETNSLYADVLEAASINYYAKAGGHTFSYDGQEITPSNYMTVLGNVYTGSDFVADYGDGYSDLTEAQANGAYQFALDKIYVALITGVESVSFADAAFAAYDASKTNDLKSMNYSLAFTEGLAVSEGVVSQSEYNAIAKANNNDAAAVYADIFETVSEEPIITASSNTVLETLDVQAASGANQVSYDYETYAVSSDSLIALNETLNGYINTINDIKDIKLIGDYLVKIINNAIKSFGVDITLDTLVNMLTDVVINLAEHPGDTIFALMPFLVNVIDNLAAPALLGEEQSSANEMLFGTTESREYADRIQKAISRIMELVNGGDFGIGDIGELLSILTDEIGISNIGKLIADILGGLFTADVSNFIKKCGGVFGLLKAFNVLDITQYSQQAGDATLGYDQDAPYVNMNRALPMLLNWICGNTGYLSANDLTYYNTDPDGDGEAEYAENVPVITNLYVVDNALAGLYGLDSITGGMDATVAEILSELITFATSTVTDLYGPNGSTQLDGGANDLFSALPEIVNGLGQDFAEKYSIDTDWHFGSFIRGSYGSASTNSRMTVIDKLSDISNSSNYALNASNAQAAMEEIVNVFANGWINALLDLLNDVVGTENAITGEIPIVSGLLNALGGFSEQSILTDVINNVFQLDRDSKYSFTFETRDNGYVGIPSEVGYFLIENMDTLISIIMQIVENTQAAPAAASAAPYAITQDAPAAAAEAAEASAISRAAGGSSISDADEAAADQLMTTLDGILADVLDGSFINDYSTSETDSILSGVFDLLSNYIGASNSSAYLRLLDGYMNNIIVAPKADGTLDEKDVYNNDNLTNFVVRTYALLEDIIDVVGDENLAATQYNDNYNLAVEAIKGVISPDAVGIRLSDNTSAQNKIMDLDSWNDAIQNGKVNVSIDWNVKTGDKESFYEGMASSLRVVSSILSVLLLDTGYYANVLQPILAGLLSDMDVQVEVIGEGVTTPSAAVLPASEVNTADDALMAIIRPFGAVLNALQAQPLTTVVDVVKGLAKVLQGTNPDLLDIVLNLVAPLDSELLGLADIIRNLSPSLADKIESLEIVSIPIEVSGISATIAIRVEGIVVDASSIMPGLVVTVPIDDVAEFKTTWNTIASILGGVLDIDLGTINGQTILSLLGMLDLGVTIPELDLDELASASDAKALLIIVYFVLDLLDANPSILGGNETVAGVLDFIRQNGIGGIIDIINTILSITTSPTEVYWMFVQKFELLRTGFEYPLGVTAADADNAVDQLDNLVSGIFPLLSSLGVMDVSGLSGLISDNLYTNNMVTTIAKGLYGAMEGDIASYLSIVGVDTSTKGVAKLLNDSSYGKTYSAAAKTLNGVSSWSKVSSLNWRFQDGDQDGFIEALSAALRPLNDLLALLLVEGNIDLSGLVNSVDVNTGAFKLQDGKLVITVSGKDVDSEDSTITIDLGGVLKQLQIYGGNGYDSAIIPLLEALGCTGVKTYSHYVSDYNKAKDNLLINVLNPIFSLVDKIAEKPFDTLTGMLPNLAYFLENGGLGQFVNNLLSPVTKLISDLDAKGINIDEIIEMIAGKDLNTLVKDALGIDLGLSLTNLGNLNIHSQLIPLVNSLLKSSGINLQLSNIDWKYLASLGELKTYTSASDHYGTPKRVAAYKGQVLITVLRYLLDNVLAKNNFAMITGLVNGIDMDATIKNILASVFNTLSTATSDEIIRALFELLNGTPTNAFWDYTGYKFKSYDFSYPADMDMQFIQDLGATIDNLLTGFIDLNGTIADLIYKDDIINTLAEAIYTNVEKVTISGSTTLIDLLAQTGIDLSTSAMADLLVDKDYGKTFSSVASKIRSAGSWANVNFDKLSWGVTDRESFLNALCAVLRPAYGVLDVLLNDGMLGLFSLLYIPGSDGYTSTIVPFMEALSLYNIKTQYQYREDIATKGYDYILLDILNPLFDKVEDLLYAPIQTLSGMLPNLAYFFANGGLLQMVDNLVTPVTALLDTLSPIVNVNDLLAELGVSINGQALDLYHISSILEPYVAPDKVVPLLNSLLQSLDINGTKLNITLLDIDWYQLASHGELVREPSQAATYGIRSYVKADEAETLIAVLRYLVAVIQDERNLDNIIGLVNGLVGDNSTVSGIVSQVISTISTSPGDEFIAQIGDLLATIAG